MSKTSRRIFIASLTLTMLGIGLPSDVRPQTSAAPTAAEHASTVLVELFTSEGCSDCPPADQLLRQINGYKTPAGQLIVAISEHVSYWNRLGWKDPFSSELYTDRQNDYGGQFGLSSVYTPQMVVDGREQFVGSNSRALQDALAIETKRKQIVLRIDSVQIKDNNVEFSYTASDMPAKDSLRLVAVLTDNEDQSSVLRGENSGRKLTHVAVARALVQLGLLHEVERRSVTLPLPPSFRSDPDIGHHLVIFAQHGGSGAVMGVDSQSVGMGTSNQH